MGTPTPGSDGDRVSDDVLVFRVGRSLEVSPRAQEQKETLLAVMFELSSDDKRSPGKRLSVWVESLTVADQAWDFLGSKPAYTVVACLTVLDIHTIPQEEGFRHLQVEWEQALCENETGAKVPEVDPMFRTKKRRSFATPGQALVA